MPSSCPSGPLRASSLAIIRFYKAINYLEQGCKPEMCNSFTFCKRKNLEIALDSLADMMGVLPPKTVADQDTQRHRVVYPGMNAPVALISTSSDGIYGLEVESLDFGIPQPWKSGGPVFNARIESLLRGGKPWGNALATSRCMLPCSTFFETHATQMAKNAKTGRPVKQRYVFGSPDAGPLFLAAIRSEERFAVVTTNPNQDVAPLHNRMPLVLTMAEAALWLDPETPIQRLAQLADRSRISLTSKPVHAQPSDDSQLRLPLF